MAKFKWKSEEEKQAEEAEALKIEEEKACLESELRSAPDKMQALQEENMMLMLASAETYEQMYNENMNLMLAIAEMYEAFTGGSV